MDKVLIVSGSRGGTPVYSDSISPMDVKYTLNKSYFVDADGNLRIARFARDAGCDKSKNEQELRVCLSSREVEMHGALATGIPLTSNNHLGADVIRLAAGDGFEPHTHPGDHLIVVLGGEGTVTYAGKIYPTYAGQIYLIEGNVPHAVGAITDHVIMAIGSPHKAVDAPDRMELVDYEAVTTEIRELYCLICDKKAIHPQTLAELGCEHCPSRLINS